MSLIAQKLISASGGVQEETDDDFNLVTGLYHFDGSNGAQNNTFLDSSTNGFTVTRQGSTTQGTFTPFSSEEGKWSIEFDGSVYCSSATSDDFEFGTGNYTIEAWVWKNTTGQQHVYDGRWPDNAERILFYVNSSDKLAAYIDGSVKGAATSDFPLNQWVHIALTRSGTTGYLFQNGSQVATWTGDSVDIEKPPYSIFIGRDSYGANYYWNGFMSNIRVLKGTAAYTGSSYSVPTSPLTAITNTKLLTARMNRFIDSSASAHVMTNNGIGVTPFSPFAPSSSYSAAVNGGSGYFDGSGDYLTVPTSDDFAFGTGDYTIEAWVFLNSTGSGQHIYDARDNSATSARLLFYVTSAGKLRFLQNNTTKGTSSDDVPLNSWVHIAVCRSSATGYLFMNGAQVATWSSDTLSILKPSSNLYIGANYSGSGNYTDGFISSLRVLKGTALYTSAFTPPTAPLTAVTNTKLLLSFTNAAMFDQTGKTNVETVGNAQLDTGTKKFGTASLELDGTGDYLLIPSNNFIPFGSGDFTVECFLNIDSGTSSTGNQDAALMDCRASGATANGFGLGLRPNGTTNFQLNFYTDGASNLDGQTMNYGTWYHVAISRSGSTIRFFVNGTTTTNITKSNNFSDQPNVTIGSSLNYSSSSITGFIDEFRLTHKARYTSNFTAPSKEFPNR